MSALHEFFKSTDLERSLLIGYYGGGNYGDELLLEVLQNVLKKSGADDVTISYFRPDNFHTYHHDFGYRVIDGQDYRQLISASFKNRNIIIGGGGLWGLDAGAKIFLMSLWLFVFRFVFFKKIYLLGVGYYDSTTNLGRLSAWLAGKAANLVIARDAESKDNFHEITRNVEIDDDMAFLIDGLDLADYAHEASTLAKQLGVRGPCIYITLRKFKNEADTEYNNKVRKLVTANPDKQFLISLLQTEEEYPEGAVLIRELNNTLTNVLTLSPVVNPVVLLAYFRQRHTQFKFITLQYHAIITAMLCGIRFLPITYDNKVTELLISKGLKPVDSAEVKIKDLQRFIDEEY